MTVINKIQAKASERNKTVIFPETGDERILKAATFLVDEGICEVILVGGQQAVLEQAAKQKVNLSPKLQFSEIESSPYLQELIQQLYSRRKEQGMSLAEATQKMNDPLYIGAGLVAIGQADACVAGSVATTGEVIRAAIDNIGLRPGTDTASSIFLMTLKEGQTITYADCGVVPYPDATQLADIAIESARTHQLLTGEKPVVALLSFSTKGSAEHQRAQLVSDALKIVQSKAPDLLVDGELQFDAAYVPEVARRKAPGSPVAGKANIFIFPNLDAGNIAYKITERLAGAGATGPILQGLARPMMDLSRGCSWQDIVNAACVAILMGNR